MHSTMLPGSLGTRIIQKNKEKTSVPSCFALEAPMRSRARKTRKARLHVNGGILIPRVKKDGDKKIASCVILLVVTVSGGQKVRKRHFFDFLAKNRQNGAHTPQVARVLRTIVFSKSLAPPPGPTCVGWSWVYGRKNPPCGRRRAFFRSGPRPQWGP